MRGRRSLWFVLAALVGAVLVLIGVRYVNDDPSAPFSAASLQATVRVDVVPQSRAQAAVDRFAGRGRLSAPIDPSHANRQLIVGQLTIGSPHPAAHGQLAVFVIDNDSHVVASAMFAIGRVGDDVGQGWDGAYDKLAAKYPWLAPLRSRTTEDGSTDPGMAVQFAPGTRGPVTFVAKFDSDVLPISRPEQLTVALAYLSDDGDPYWAHRLTLTL